MRSLFFALSLLIALLLSSISHAADIETITHGDTVDLEKHLVAGKYVLFDFYADWCGPCRGLEPTLIKLASQQSESLALRKVDIIDFQSAVSRQYGISSIPHLKLFGPDGSLIAEGGAASVLGALESRLGSGIIGAAQQGSSSSTMPFLIFAALLGIVVYLLFFKGKTKTQPGLVPAEHRTWAPEERAPSDAIWFVMMQGSLNGPFSVDDLEDLKRRKCILGDTKIRRKGDSDWRNLSDLRTPSI